MPSKRFRVLDAYLASDPEHIMPHQRRARQDHPAGVHHDLERLPEIGLPKIGDKPGEYELDGAPS
jgi:hypothetical protein